MALKIRLRQQGRSNRPFYRLVVADVRSPRDGKYVEMLGWYNPFEAEQEKSTLVKEDRVQHWLNLGAELTEKAQALIEKAVPRLLQAKKEKVIEQRAKKAEKRKQRKKTVAAQ